MMKTFGLASVIFILFCTADLARADTIVNSLISSDTTWTKAGSPYLVKDIIVIDKGAVLSIEPRVVVRFDPSTLLTVRGSSQACGIADDPIQFTSDGSAWAGVAFDSGGKSSLWITFVSEMLVVFLTLRLKSSQFRTLLLPTVTLDTCLILGLSLQYGRCHY